MRSLLDILIWGMCTNLIHFCLLISQLQNHELTSSFYRLVWCRHMKPPSDVVTRMARGRLMLLGMFWESISICNASLPKNYCGMVSCSFLFGRETCVWWFFRLVCWVFRTGRDAGGTGCRAHVPGLVCPTILRHFESVAEYFSQLNLLQIKLMTRRLQCSESRGRMSWKRPACLMPVLYESSMLYSLQSLHGQAIKRRLWGDCRSGQGFLEVVAPGKWKYLTNITENMRSYLHPKCQSLELYVEMANL